MFLLPHYVDNIVQMCILLHYSATIEFWLHDSTILIGIFLYLVEFVILPWLLRPNANRFRLRKGIPNYFPLRLLHLKLMLAILLLPIVRSHILLGEPSRSFRSFRKGTIDSEIPKLHVVHIITSVSLFFVVSKGWHWLACILDFIIRLIDPITFQDLVLMSHDDAFST